MKIHPVAELFPLLSGASFESLVNNIRENGQIDPVVFYEGELLDGRNRLRVCETLGIVPKSEEWNGQGGTPTAFIISKNLERRHMKDDERAMVAAEIADMRQGARNDLTPNGGKLSQPEAAKLLNVSERSVERAAKVLKDGVEPLKEMLADGKIKLTPAAEIAALPPTRQMRIIRRGRTHTKKLLLKKKTKALKKSSNSLLADCVLRPLAEDEFISMLEIIAHAQPRYKRYLQDVINELTEENLSDETRDAIESVLAATDYGYQTRAKIREKTRFEKDFLEHILTHCLDYGILETYQQGGKTEGARGAKNECFRRPTGEIKAKSETDNQEIIEIELIASFDEMRDSVIERLRRKPYQTAKKLSQAIDVKIEDILLIVEGDEDIQSADVGMVTVYFHRKDAPKTRLYNGGDGNYYTFDPNEHLPIGGDPLQNINNERQL